MLMYHENLFYMDINILQTAAREALQQAPILKPSLPPKALAIHLADGTILAAHQVITSSVINAPAAARLLFSYFQKNSALPPITATWYEGHPLLEDTLLLQAYSAVESVIYLQEKPYALNTLHDFAPVKSSTPIAENAYSLEIITPETRVYYQNVTLLAENDPTDLTPMRAALADLQTFYKGQPWQTTKIIIRPLQQEIYQHRFDFPISARDLQAARREILPTVPVFIEAAHGENKTTTLAEMMPAAYRSGHTVSCHIPTYSLWKNASAATLDALLEENGLCQRLDEEVRQIVPLLKGAMAPRAAVGITQRGTIIRGANFQIPPSGILTCAETVAMRHGFAIEPAMQLKVLFLEITAEDGIPLLGEEAAPCGFCRESLARCADANTIIIQSNRQGQYRFAYATELLQQSQNYKAAPAATALLATQYPSLTGSLAEMQNLAQSFYEKGRCLPIAVAYSSDTQQLYIADSSPNAYADCRYPPMLAQALLLAQTTATRFFVLQKQAVVTVYLRANLPSVAESPDTPVFLGTLHGSIFETTVSKLQTF